MEDSVNSASITELGREIVEPLRENFAKANLSDETTPLTERDLKNTEDIAHWKKECQQARGAAEAAKREADAFLQCYAEMEELLQTKEEEHNRLRARLQSLEYQVEAANRETHQWRTDFERLGEEIEVARATEVSFSRTSIGIQVWETELQARTSIMEHFRALRRCLSVNSGF